MVKYFMKVVVLFIIFSVFFITSNSSFILINNASAYEKEDYGSSAKKDFDKKKVVYFNNIKDACKNSDLLIIHTEWNEFKQLNFNRLKNEKKFKIYDLRNLYSPKKMKNKNIDYFSIGR